MIYLSKRICAAFDSWNIEITRIFLPSNRRKVLRKCGNASFHSSFPSTCPPPLPTNLAHWQCICAIWGSWKNLLLCNAKQSKMTFGSVLVSVFSFRFQFSFLSFAPFLRSCSVFSPFFSFFFFFIFFLLLFSLLIANCSFASDKQQSTQDWGLHYKTTWGLGMVRLLRPGLGLGVGLGLWSCSCIQIFLIKCLMAMRRGFNCTWLRAYRQME